MILVFVISCRGEKMIEETKPFPIITDIPESKWEGLSKKRIYFGHQSVGFNIIDGLKDVMKDNPMIKLNIVETTNINESDISTFAHSKIGKNLDPISKIDDFVNIMKKGLGNRVDIAFFKFCYVDITTNTDIQRIFSDYNNAMSGLKGAFPNTTFVYLTVPLTSKRRGGEAWIKKAKDIVKGIIGRPVFKDYDNIRREQFNEMIRQECVGKNSVFDLARIESTLPDGTRERYKKDGKTYYTLVPEYTDDGGHLNMRGRRIVAEQLLIFLASELNNPLSR